MSHADSRATSQSSSRGRKRPSSSSRSGTNKSSKSSPYSSNFEQKLIDQGIFPHNRGPKPANWQEGKSSKGRADVAKRQACYNGVVGARAMHTLQNYGAASVDYDDKAYTLTTTYHDGQLKLFTVHPTSSNAAGASTEYKMTQLKAFAMTSDRETFQKGATAYRNGREWSERQRKTLVDRANQVAGGLSSTTFSSTSLSGL